MAKVKSRKPKKLFSPFLLSLAAMTGWAATHEPASFSNSGMAGAWLLSAFAIGLLVRAVLALAAPLGGLGMESLRLAFNNPSGSNQRGVE
ncbi:MAG: hypothetical protein KGQ79_00070 [Proteobacteria bacterium]|nr:hypothetical protein [Pseudomonadota bacterium]MBU6426112.1 hypothetical protein [Rhodospirillales bacterium]